MIILCSCIQNFYLKQYFFLLDLLMFIPSQFVSTLTRNNGSWPGLLLLSLWDVVATNVYFPAAGGKQRNLISVQIITYYHIYWGGGFSILAWHW